MFNVDSLCGFFNHVPLYFGL